MPAAIVCLLLLASPQSDCADVASCRQAALDAAARGEFESFHDLAWRTAQKGRPNDPELMALVARAQSLSGRPGDALVMLRRLAQMGVATEAATSDDFRRVRALAGWPELEAALKGNAAAAATTGTTPTPAQTSSAGTGTARAARAVKTTAAPAAAREVAAAPPSKTADKDDEELPPSLAEIQPAGLAYDSVSRRFIVGDRRENKLVIFDAVFKQATNMTGAESAGFFGLSAIEIDRRRGDLWAANSSAVRGASLHKLQLVSGRVLFEVVVPPELGPATFVDAAVLDDGRVVLLDVQGRRLLSLLPGQRAFQRTASVDVEGATSLTPGKGDVFYVAHKDGLLRVDGARSSSAVRNAPGGLLRIRADGRALTGVQSAGDGLRIVRLRLDAAGKHVTRVDVLEQSAALLDPSAITIANGFVYYMTSVNGSTVMRRVKADR